MFFILNYNSLYLAYLQRFHFSKLCLKVWCCLFSYTLLYVLYFLMSNFRKTIDQYGAFYASTLMAEKNDRSIWCILWVYLNVRGKWSINTVHSMRLPYWQTSISIFFLQNDCLLKKIDEKKNEQDTKSYVRDSITKTSVWYTKSYVRENVPRSYIQE